MNGILLMDKPEGLTSAEVVRRVKRRVGGKVGHLGTLDPFATGVLPLCLGEATKIAQFVSPLDKTYEGIIRLGTATDTGDRTGRVVRTSPVPQLSDELLAAVSHRFTGPYLQTPPMHSAIKRGGVPLYRLARKGIEVERQAREVRIGFLRLERRDSERLHFEVKCSKGTYVRVLAEDVGTALETVAHLEELRRTAFGDFAIAQAVSLENWQPGRTGDLISIRQALGKMPSVRLNDDEAAAVRQGRPWVLTRVAERGDSTVTILVDSGDAAVAVAVKEGHRWGYGRVFHQHQTLQPDNPVLIDRTK